jgi:hypothetical protein
VGNSRKEIKEQIMARQAQIKLNEKPDDWSAEAVDFINKVIYFEYINVINSACKENHPEDLV